MVDLDYKNTKHPDELESHSQWLERGSFRIVLISTFTALSIVSGYMLVMLPNIEVFTLMIFLSGFILGKRDGAIIGLMSAFIFGFFNPLGSSMIDLFLFSVQLIYYTSVGFIGGLTCKFLEKKDFFKPLEDIYIGKVLLLFGILGAVMTFTYDIFSTLAGAIFLFGNLESFLTIYALGLPYTMVHLIFNILGFIFLLPGLIRLLYKLLDIPNDCFELTREK